MTSRMGPKTLLMTSRINEVEKIYYQETTLLRVDYKLRVLYIIKLFYQSEKSISEI